MSDPQCHNQRMVPRANGDWYCRHCHAVKRVVEPPTLYENRKRPCQEFPGYRLVPASQYEPENVITLNKDDARG